MTVADLGSLALQILVIVAAARLAGALLRRLGQPPVVGEMLAGIVLGPSVVGALFPEQHAALFPESTRATLTLLAQVGVMLFMLVVGTRVEVDVFHRHTRAIVAIAATGVAVPFALGCLLAVPLYDTFVAPSIPRTPFILFVATALSVTAFPVLARIIKDRGLDNTAVGRTALVCAAMNDAIAWVLVASVVGLVSTGPSPVPAIVHGIFMAFVAGVVLAAVAPRAVRAVERIEMPASLVLLPIFFALTGLRTNLALGSSASWMWVLAIIAVATVGKLGATALAARATGFQTLDALMLGALMNTRGLMELVVLNIGYELGLLPPNVFAMMVTMALVTTLMAGPLIAVRQRSSRRRTRTTDGPP